MMIDWYDKWRFICLGLSYPLVGVASYLQVWCVQVWCFLWFFMHIIIVVECTLFWCCILCKRMKCVGGGCNFCVICDACSLSCGVIVSPCTCWMLVSSMQSVTMCSAVCRRVNPGVGFFDPPLNLPGGKHIFWPPCFETTIKKIFVESMPRTPPLNKLAV